MRDQYDVVVIGSGPNGLAAAVGFAGAGLSTLVIEASESPGGGTRTKELTLPGFLHDVCSSVHPFGLASPWFRELGLDRELDWVQPPASLAHVLDEDRVVTLERSVDATAAQLGNDKKAYRNLMRPFVDRFDELLGMTLAPLRFPKAPLLLARFGIDAFRSMRGLAHVRFRGDEAPALLAGIAAHAMIPLDNLASASFGLLLGLSGHAVGWPIVRGGSRVITDALLARFYRAGGELVLGRRVDRMSQLPRARAYVFDVTPRQLLSIAGDRLPAAYRQRLAKFRYGPGVYKIDWALSAPVPWRDLRCTRAATVHLSGTVDQIARAEQAVHDGSLAQEPFILFVQPSLFDPTRAPAGMHVGWAYCHVPHGSDVDARLAIEDHIERFAPGFKDVILARSEMNPAQMTAYNANYVGGDINGGLSDLRQLFTRPLPKLDPYATGAPDIFLCSSSTPPGGGVHGMCGYWAARSVLARVFSRELLSGAGLGWAGDSSPGATSGARRRAVARH
jgi:phytoene dehydrogenase-like protein